MGLSGFKGESKREQGEQNRTDKFRSILAAGLSLLTGEK